MLTDDELQAIWERCEAATPGPWEGDDANVYTEWSREEYAEERGYNPEGTGFDEIRICEINAYNADISDEEVKANEQFIAHSRTDIPALLAHIDAMRREMEDALAKSEADKSALVEALEWHCENCREQCKLANSNGVRTECNCARCPSHAALARVKEKI